jgi:hypothetical protein
MESGRKRTVLYTVCPLHRPREREEECVWFAGGSLFRLRGFSMQREICGKAHQRETEHRTD